MQALKWPCMFGDCIQAMLDRVDRACRDSAFVHPRCTLKCVLSPLRGTYIQLLTMRA